MFEKEGLKEGIQILYPPIELCTDNAAMIGSAGYYNYLDGKISALDLKVMPNLSL